MEAYDTIFPIFIRLSVKSLLRFQSVSKSWNAIISDKEFKKIHIDQSKSSSLKKFLLVQMKDGVFEFRDSKNPQIVMGKQKYPLKRFQNPIAMCSCDCLLLMKASVKENIYVLWNSYTNEYSTLVCPYWKGTTPSKGMTPHGCGLCYDSEDDDYKVILIYKSFYAVYHVKRNRWTKKTIVLNLVHYHEMSQECSRGISVNGYVFWSLDSIIDQVVFHGSTITYYDVKSDELKKLQIPDYISGQWFHLTSLKGCICLYGVRRELDVWIKEQDGWTRLMEINCNNSDFRDQLTSNIVLLGCTRNGEILLQVGWRLERLVMYDPKRHKFIQTARISEDSKHDRIPTCSESFYFPIET
ncbi:hypothetical protein MTR67_041659 [Solanum verrucosum]|uniref:F-box domain-containing protein n=1 Tax=Solanum verrucosum TaxID=315347 RepID=A0AAF0ZTE3_SOLVR|nr:hypothetical protein MTR67_041659 [Solanum verrucosum]